NPPADSAALHRWARRLSLLAIFSGGIWATAGLLFYAPGSSMQQALLAILLCGLAAGSIPANAMLMNGLLGSAAAILGVFIARLAWENDSGHWLMAAMLSVYLGFVLNWGRNLNRVLVQSLRARHRNEELIEQLRQQTEAARMAQHVAEEASVAKSKFLAAASHDLRQPMHALTLFSGALMNENRPAEMVSLAGHIVRSVEALEMLFNSLLDISKLDAGVTQPVLADFPLDAVFARLRNDFSRLAGDKRLRLHIRATAAVVRTDAQLLEQILRNLTANAVRYTETGGVVVGCRRRGDAWHIEVVDSGIGIALAEQGRIFDEFYQIGNQERDRKKGLGLGLAIVRRLTRLLGLSLSLRSRVGRGSVFSLTVPAGILVAKARAEVQDVRVDFDALRVLVVDDETDVRLALTLLLRGWGCDVLDAESHVQAVAAMEAHQWQPEFAIVDFRLRDGETGIAVLDWLREHFGTPLPGILITGDIAADRLQEVKSSGYRLLHKPVSPAKLRALLRNLSG
ncbi:MAG TPA: hybrid sensor histidine kinase/response regulator, partial [Rhodocyclaceae bacterium]|nr:hybrid sensor histidine kinase/response regulator [Rhodocyclaceae bacterium]